VTRVQGADKLPHDEDAEGGGALGQVSAPIVVDATAARTCSPSQLVMIDHGIIVTWNGTMSVAMITANRAVRPGNGTGRRLPGQRATHQGESTVATATRRCDPPVHEQGALASAVR